MLIFNIVIIYIIVNVYINIITHSGITNILSCGIFAWVGKDVKRFNRWYFNILGMFNDSRGGDSCGLYYDGQIEKGINKTARYQNLIPSLNLYNTLSLKQYPVIIGHDRKVSVGLNNLLNTQPIALHDTDNNIVWVQAHNGTISNYRELATKYGVTIETGESDSLVLTKLVDLVGFKILSEYEGSAALVMYNLKEPNVLYAFKGASKTSAYSAMFEERPLAYLTIPNKGTFISSDIDHLKNFEIDEKITPIEFKPNIIYRLEGDTVTEFMKIDRSNVVKAPVAYQNNWPITNSNTSGSLNKSKTLSSYKVSKVVTDCIYYDSGIFKINDLPAHGRYVVNNSGEITDKGNKYDKYELFFLFGILLKHREGYETMSKLLIEKKVFTFKDFYCYTTWDTIVKPNLKLYSAFPFWRWDETVVWPYIMAPNSWNVMVSPTTTNQYVYSGIFQPLFSKQQFHINYGDVLKVSELAFNMTIKRFINAGYHKKHSLDFSFKDTPLTYDILSTPEDKNNNVTLICPQCNAFTYYEKDGEWLECELCDMEGYVTEEVYNKFKNKQLPATITKPTINEDADENEEESFSRYDFDEGLDNQSLDAISKAIKKLSDNLTTTMEEVSFVGMPKSIIQIENIDLYDILENIELLQTQIEQYI